MTRLALSFLGGFQAALGGRPLTEFKSNKVRALLAYLAVEADRPHRREALAGLLWPEWTDRDALSNLRYSLASLRKTLGDRSATTPFLLITHDSVQFNQASDTWLDVAELERQIVDTRDHWTAGTGVDALRSALSLYQGGFLEGFSVGDAAPFEEWALLRGEHIARQVMSTLSTLVAELEALGDYKEAQAYARQQVALEPWNEAAHRSLMRALALDDQRNAALHQFQVCRRILNDELGVAPGEETLALYETIRSGEPVDKGASLCRPASPVFTSTQQPGLPSSLVVAREEQLARLNNLLAEALAGMGRVVFVTGEAGSGKTVLLGEFSRRAMQAHADLLVARGTCDAAIGIGDPYLPFREILQLLTGDIESRRVGGMPTLEQARRLWAAIPDAVQALVEQGPDLIDTFVPGASLSLRTEAFARQAGRAAWWARLQQLRQSTAGDDKGSGQALQLTDIFEQVTHVLQELARRHPLCLVLDDLQWADAGSVSLLLHFGRRIANSRILVVAAYRPDAIAAQAETERHPLEQVYELAQHPALESSPQRGTALATVASFAMWSADLERGLEIGSQLLGLAETSGDAHQLLVAHFLLGGVRFLSGRLVLAREHFDRALALHDRQSFDPQDTVFGFHAGVISLVWQSAVLWQLGYPDQGSRVLQEALTAAEQSNHAITLAFARASAAIVLYVVGRDAAAGWQQADALRRLRQVGPSMESWADSVAGRSATGQGQDDEEGLRQMREGLAGFKMLGGQVGRAGQLMVLAQSYARAGQVGRGLEAMDEALVWVGRSGVTTMQAEAYRLRGELLVAGWPREPEAVAAVP